MTLASRLASLLVRVVGHSEPPPDITIPPPPRVPVFDEPQPPRPRRPLPPPLPRVDTPTPTLTYGEAPKTLPSPPPESCR